MTVTCHCGFRTEDQTELNEHGEPWLLVPILKDGTFRKFHVGETLTSAKLNEIVDYLNSR